MPAQPTGETRQGARRTIRTTDSYQEAERAVDYLSDQGFDVAGTTIVGTGLRYVEQVAGRVGNGRAAMVGAGQGAWVGLFFSLLFSLFFDLSSGDYFGLLLYGLVAGALFGGLWSWVFHLLQGGRRDFASTSHTRAETYEVMVDESVAEQATQLLARMPPPGVRTS
jgi:hypothetical protein